LSYLFLLCPLVGGSCLFPLLFEEELDELWCDEELFSLRAWFN